VAANGLEPGNFRYGLIRRLSPDLGHLDFLDAGSDLPMRSLSGDVGVEVCKFPLNDLASKFPLPRLESGDAVHRPILPSRTIRSTSDSACDG
jgi:hypothetical protein